MMVNILTITIGVVLGTLITSCISMGLLMNKKFFTKFMVKYTKMVLEVTEEMFGEFNNDKEEAEQ